MFLLLLMLLLSLGECSVMADQIISLRWAGRGTIQSDNITPVALVPDKKRSYKKITPKNSNLIIEGDNAPVMKSLCAGTLRMRGKIDFMLWDPPYNTGNNDFIYEDNFYLTKKDQKTWESKNSNKILFDIKTDKKGLTLQPTKKLDLWVKETDASRHSKWLSFMEVRLELAKKLLKDTGVIAVHISYHELFRLGLLMDEIFGEDNRLGIINWECYYSPKNDKKNALPSTTDYILIYAKNKKLAFRGHIPRTKEMNSRYKSPDGDSRLWESIPLLATSGSESYRYGIQNPFTGEIHYPKTAYWRRSKENIKKMLQGWGITYIEDKNGNLVTSGKYDKEVLMKKLSKPWPLIHFGKEGKGVPRLKSYLEDVIKKNQGKSIGTYWGADEILDESFYEPINLSLSHELSGHNDGAKKLMKAILGDKCAFDTPKPLKLTERLIEMFCPKDGVVLDAFGGSATTAHAVLSLNAKDTDSDRKFVIIERGSKDYGFADSITAERVRKVISGKWVHPTKDTKATGGSFVYMKAGKPISGKYILESKRDDLIDIILTSHEGSVALDDEEIKKSKYVIGRDSNNNAIALVWDPKKGAERGHLTMKIHKEILNEVKALKLKKPVFIYGSVNAGPNGSPSYSFRQIPDEILAALEVSNLRD
jgi:adenine-specific DNA-methyltransferase